MPMVRKSKHTFCIYVFLLKWKRKKKIMMRPNGQSFLDPVFWREWDAVRFFFYLRVTKNLLG